jgi:hypothetical protein
MPPVKAPPVDSSATFGPGAVAQLTHGVKPKSSPAPVAPNKAPKPPVAAPTPPVAPVPLEKPVPVLQAHGFNGGINTFNQRVQSVHDSYTQAYGVAPSPGLVFDLAKSPVDTQDFNKMFTVPQSQFVARSRGAINSQADDHLHVRKDGLLVKPSPPGLPPADAVTKLHAQFPTVQMGMLPIPGGDKIMGAFAAIGAVKGSLAVQSGGMTLVQAQDVQRQASQGIPVDPAQKALSEKVLRTGNAVTTVQHSLTTVRDAQAELNKAMGTKLPADGTFNDDWLKALSNWMKTRDYFQRAAVQQATDAGFKDYGSYLKAWKAKQHAVSHNGAFQFFLNALPMHVFSDGGNPLQVLKHLETDMFLLSNPQFSPSYPLHALTRSAGDALAVVGGTVSQAKAYAQAGAAFAKTVDDTRLQKGGTNYDLALRKAKEALAANPSWLHIFAPGTIDSKDGRVATLDQITNIAGDILLLRKPAFTGERVLPGSQSAARASSYLDRSGTFSFDYLKQGKLGRAAAMLEGGPGAEQFVGKAAKLVKDGKLSQEQYLEHLSELYSTGRTELRLPDGLVANPTHAELATSGEVLLHGTHRSFDTFGGDAAANRYGRVTDLAKRRSYFTNKDEVATTFAHSGAFKQVDVAHWAEAQGEDWASLSKVERTEYRSKLIGQLNARIKKGERLFYTDDKGALVRAHSAQSVPRDQWVDGDVRIYAADRTPRVIKATVYGKTLDLTDPANVPEDLAAILKKEGRFNPSDPMAGIYFKHEFSPALIDYAEKNGFGKIKVKDAYESGFESTIGLHSYVDTGAGAPILAATPETILREGQTLSVSGPVLSSLRQGHLNTPTALKQGIQKWLRDRADAFDAGLRKGGRPGTAAADFTAFVRSEFSHAAPKNAARGYFDPKLPERVHDFALRNFKDANLANSFESALIRARATENVQKIQAVEEKLQGLYYKKFPVGDGAPIKDDPFKAQLESESASRFHFPGGNQKEVGNPFDRIAQRAKGITQGLNAISAKHRLIILSGFPLNLVPVAGKAVAGRSLFWKHMVGDTTRRFVGGDTIIGTGLGGTKKEVAALVNADPSLARQWGAFIDRTTNSETRYLTASGEKAVPEFDTSSRFGDKAYMRGAGGYVRRMLDDHALAAYMSSTPGNLQPLVDLILKNKTYRALFNKAYKVDTTQGVTTLAQRLEYAESLFTRYRELEDAAHAANTSLDDALSTLAANRGGKADDALGKWISGNKVGLTVKHALVEQGSSFDQTTSEYIKHIMVFNKLNRGGMAKNIAAGVYDDLKAAGWEDKVALRTAMDVSEKQTVYHMLDFANMLQAEQDLRWLSYFATKHRLYWKWVLGTFVRNPGAAAAIEDAKQHLDDRGNLNFTVPLGPLGDKWSVPAARLFWVPGKEYSEVAPTTNFLLGYVKGGFSIQAGVNAVAGTFGNVLTRSDTMLHLLSTAAAIEAGKLPGTYASATKNLDPSTQSKLNRAINHYQQDYFAEHGHYAPERQAVLRSLWRVGAEEGWRANLPLPVVPQSTTGNDTQKLLDGFMRLTDPAKKSKYLDDHPELAAQFGVSKDPADYQHYRTYWSQYTQALDQYHGIRQHLFEQAQKIGYTVEIDAVRRKASADFQKVFDRLKRQDLAQTDPARRKEMNGENLGLWGQQVSADPLVDPKTALTTLFPNIDPRQLAAAIPSQTVKDAKMNLRLLSDPKYVAAVFTDNPGDAKTYKRFLLQFIDDFRSYPHDALGKVQTKYVQEHVNTYWQHITGQLDHIATLGRGDKDLAYAKLRVWKDTQDKPVTVDGIRFPSPVALAWASLPPDERTKRLAGVAGGSWDHLADYEKRLLGVETPKGMSAAWLDYQESIVAYRDKYPGARLDKSQIQFLAKAENKDHPGFLKDWVFAQQSTVDRLEKTALFQEMPVDARKAWDSEIGPSAKKIAQALRSGNYDNAVVRKAWKDYVHTDVPAFLGKHPALNKWVQPYLTANPDFFTSLPVR